ncbi:hypothetical protein FQA39_LY01689 [Lamprigera yunnana]|nr:hypothetical protein FQA39_LY01689 [Lamprigera yunnana]
MLASVILIIILGVISVGGIEDVWLRAVAGNRLSIFEFDVAVRDTFWSVSIGSIFHYMCLALLNQSAMQKFMAVSTNAHASRAIAIFCIGFIVLTLLVICVGVIAYAKYWDCDPLTTNQVERLDQLIPLLAMEVAGKIPGVPGIFIAGVFCASLSSLSSSLNTISCSIYEDFIAVFNHKTFSETTVNVILKVIVLITGLICIALIFGFENMAGVFDFTLAVQAITNGPLLGLFTVGVLCPWVNGKGALVGGLSGLAFISWIVIGNQLYKSQGFIDYAKQMSTDGCIFGFNGTERIDDFVEPPFILYRISIWYNSLIAAIFVVISASLVSWLTKAKYHAVDANLISPIIRSLIRD